jgi:hypothetical protein
MFQLENSFKYESSIPKNLKLDSKSQHKQNSILTMRKIEAESNLHSINSGLQFKQSM